MNILGAFGPAELMLFSFVWIIPITLIILLIWMINNWVNKGLNLRKEQNELLKELIKALEKKT